MPRPGKLEELAQERQAQVLQMVIETIEATGGIAPAARKLKVHPNAVRHALEHNGLKVVRRIVAKVEQAEEA